MAGAGAPMLTVVLLVDSQRQRGEWALRAVLSQALAGGLEVLLFDFGHRDHPPLAGSQHPGVRVLPARRGAGYGDTLAEAVDLARAQVIAFIEEHVIVLPGWAQAIVAAHRAPCAAVCGEVGPGDLSCATSVRQELLSRNAWSAPARAGDAEVLRWQNVSYKREILLRYRDRLPRFLEAEGALFRRLRRDGHRLLIEPRAKLVHAHERDWTGFLTGSFHSNRLATACSIELDEQSWRRRLRAMAAAAVGPLRWPLVLLRRTRALPDRGRWQRALVAELPYVLQYYAVVAAAGLAGAALGRGESSSRFLHYELTEPRRPPEGVEAVSG